MAPVAPGEAVTGLPSAEQEHEEGRSGLATEHPRPIACESILSDLSARPILFSSTAFPPVEDGSGEFMSLAPTGSGLCGGMRTLHSVTGPGRFDRGAAPT
jgi:hypothetical protein